MRPRDQRGRTNKTSKPKQSALDQGPVIRLWKQSSHDKHVNLIAIALNLCSIRQVQNDR